MEMLSLEQVLDLQVEVKSVSFVPAGMHKAKILTAVAENYVPKYGQKKQWSDPTARVKITYEVDGVGSISTSESYVGYKRYNMIPEDQLTENISMARGNSGYALLKSLNDDGEEVFTRIIDRDATVSAQKRFSYIGSVAGIEAGSKSVTEICDEIVGKEVVIEVEEHQNEHNEKSYSKVEDIHPATKLTDSTPVEGEEVSAY